jgi:hypothetical protein
VDAVWSSVASTSISTRPVPAQEPSPRHTVALRTVSVGATVSLPVVKVTGS